jgi:glycerophosphoryl diester phosphodiesterase
VKLFRGEGRPLVIAHRGAAAVAAANSREALQAGAASGADVVEFDISPGLLVGHSLQELPETVLTLDEALEELKPRDVGLHLDVKLPGYENEVIEAARRHALGDRAYISTAYAASARRFGQAAPELRVAIGYPRDRLGVARAPWPGVLTDAGAAALRAAMPARIPVLLRWARADALSLHHTLCSRAAVATAHRLGAPVLAWTANETAAIRRLAAIGVDGIVSDDPQKALEALSLDGP